MNIMRALRFLLLCHERNYKKQKLLRLFLARKKKIKFERFGDFFLSNVQKRICTIWSDGFYLESKDTIKFVHEANVNSCKFMIYLTDSPDWGVGFVVLGAQLNNPLLNSTIFENWNTNSRRRKPERKMYKRRNGTKRKKYWQIIRN